MFDTTFPVIAMLVYFPTDQSSPDPYGFVRKGEHGIELPDLVNVCSVCRPGIKILPQAPTEVLPRFCKDRETQSSFLIFLFVLLVGVAAS